MRYRILIAFMIIVVGVKGQGFPSTDSLHRYNNRFITNSAINAFTDYRMNTLLHGMINWIDSAKLGTGGSVGMDTAYMINDSTFRYRKNSVFHNFTIRGVGSTITGQNGVTVSTGVATLGGNLNTATTIFNGRNTYSVIWDSMASWVVRNAPGTTNINFNYADPSITLNATSSAWFRVRPDGVVGFQTNGNYNLLSDSFNITHAMLLTLNSPSIKIRNIGSSSDTTTYKPLGRAANGTIVGMTSWFGGSGFGGTPDTIANPCCIPDTLFMNPSTHRYVIRGLIAGTGIGLTPTDTTITISNTSTGGNLDVVMSLGGRYTANRSFSNGTFKETRDSAQFVWNHVDSIALIINAKKAGEIIRINPAHTFNVNGQIERPWQQVLEEVDNGNSTYNFVHKMGFNVNLTYNVSYSGTWDAWESNYEPGGQWKRERHYVTQLPNGDQIRWFSHEATEGLTAATTIGNWDFRSTTFNWLNPANTQQFMGLQAGLFSLYNGGTSNTVMQINNASSFTQFTQTNDGHLNVTNSDFNAVGNLSLITRITSGTDRAALKVLDETSNGLYIIQHGTSYATTALRKKSLFLNLYQSANAGSLMIDDTKDILLGDVLNLSPSSTNETIHLLGNTYVHGHWRVEADSLLSKATNGARQMLVWDSVDHQVYRMAIPAGGSGGGSFNYYLDSVLAKGGAISANRTSDLGGFNWTLNNGNIYSTSFNIGTSGAAGNFVYNSGNGSVDYSSVPLRVLGNFALQTFDATNTNRPGISLWADDGVRGFLIMHNSNYATSAYRHVVALIGASGNAYEGGVFINNASVPQVMLGDITTYSFPTNEKIIIAGKSRFQDYAVYTKSNNTFPYTGLVGSTSDNSWGFGYTPTGGTFSKGIAMTVDTNENVSVGSTVITSTVPTYASGSSLFSGTALISYGGYYNRVLTITNGTTTIDGTYRFIQCDASSGNVVINLPAASSYFGNGVGIEYVFYRKDASGNTVTINRAGSDQINGATSFTLTAQYQTKKLQATSSSEWLQY